jgi:membrane associated rhomboid family serine protease
MQAALSWFRRQSRPATVILVGLFIVGNLLAWMFPAVIPNALGFDGNLFPKVWTVLTYPYFSGFIGPINLVFLSMWLLSIGGRIENDHGQKNYWIIWLIATAVCALPLLFVKLPAYGYVAPVACLTVMWATRFPNEIVRLFMCIPVPAKLIGWMSAAGVFFIYAGQGSLWYVGLLACIGCILAYVFASNRIPKVSYGLGYGSYVKPKKTKGQKQREDQYFSDVYLREKEREEKERLRKLFENSLED